MIVDDYIDLESYALDLEVALDEADLELTDAYLDAADFEIELEDSVEFAADELELEGAMDIIELEEFSDIHAGDFSSGDLDF